MSIVKGTKEFDKTPTVNGADVLTTGNVLDDLSNVSVAAPATGDRLEWNGSAWVPVTPSADPTSDIVEATNQISTTSSTYVLAASMTLTPAAGTYLVWFTGVSRNSKNDRYVEKAIYSGGSVVAASEREGEGGGDPPGWDSFVCTAKVTVNGSEAIEGKYRREADTGYLRERQLMILKVA